jgi:hypothetical protein
MENGYYSVESILAEAQVCPSPTVRTTAVC